MEQISIRVPATSSLYRRINYTALAVILAIVITNIWLSAIFSGKSILSSQATIMAREMVQQAAITTEYYITNASYTTLQRIADNIALSEHIQDAVIYDHQGKMMAQSENRIGIRQRMDIQEMGQSIVPFTSEVVNAQGKVIGYVSISFLQTDILEKSGEYQNNIWKQVQLMLVLAFAIGILSSRAFAKLRYRKTKVVKY